MLVVIRPGTVDPTVCSAARPVENPADQDHLTSWIAVETVSLIGPHNSGSAMIIATTVVLMASTSCARISLMTGAIVRLD
jgi:hypothetical protein